MFASFLLSPDQLGWILDCINIIANKYTLGHTEIRELRSKLITLLDVPNDPEVEDESAKMFQEIEESLGPESNDMVDAKLEPDKLEEKESLEMKLKTLENEHEKLKKQLKKEKSKKKKQTVNSEDSEKKKQKVKSETEDSGKKETIFDCNQCKYVFKTEKAQTKHLKKQHTDTAGVCPDCGKNFENKYYLSSHKRFVHDEEIHICDLCSKEIRGLAMLKLHKRRFHKELEECNLCGKMVKKLKNHVLRLHTDNANKRFKCEYCGKGFIDKADLREHVYIHSDVKPITCPEPTCIKTFTSMGNQKKHFLNIHNL